MKIQHNKAIAPPNGQLDRIATPTGHAGAVDLDIAKAKVLLAQGELDAAEQLLASIPRVPQSLDLMARLYVQKGDWRSARTTWEHLLQIDPDNPDARDALRRLSSNWLFKALATRIVQLTAVAALLAFSSAGILYIFNVLPERVPSPSPVTAVSRRPAPMPEHPSIRPPEDGDAAMQVAVQPPQESVSTADTGRPPAAPLAVAEPPETPAPAPLLLPYLSIAGATISTNDGQVSIVFDEGIFRYRCELSESAQRLLHNVVTALSDCPPVSKLLIAGHTDNDPMPTGGPFPSNYALGFARAATVASWFRSHSAIPKETIITTSRGADDPPFSNADYDSRLRNRTVVLRVQFQQPSREEQR